MFFKNKKFKKQISSLLFATAMTVASFSGVGENVFAVTSASASTIDAASELSVKSFEISKPYSANITDQITLTAQGEGGSGNYEYRFGTIIDGKEYYNLANAAYSSSNTLTTDVYRLAHNDENSLEYIVNSGNHPVFVDIKDTASGKVVRKSINYYVEGMSIESFTATAPNGSFNVGERIHLAVTVKNEAGYRYNPREFSYSTDNGKTYKIINFYGGAHYGCDFTPTQAGNYKLKYYISDFVGQKAERVIDITVAPSQAVVYYDNASWNKANIHYCVDNGSWTNVPGVQMQDSDNPKYTWKYVIDLGDASSVQVCFNDGEGHWDSCNGANYTLTAGSYCIVYGRIFNA